MTKTCSKSNMWQKLEAQLRGTPLELKLPALRHAADQLRSYVYRLETKEAEERNRALIGNCYVYTDGRNRPTTELMRDPRMYFRVDKVEGNRVTYFVFSFAEDGKIVFEPKFVSSTMFTEYPQISKKRFMHALGRARARVLKMTYGVPVVKL